MLLLKSENKTKMPALTLLCNNVLEVQAHAKGKKKEITVI